MNDLTDSGAAGDDDLYASVTSGEAILEDDLDQLGGDPAPPVQNDPPANPDPPANSPPEPAIPPARLREEAEARRAAERRIAELEGQLTAFRSQKPADPAPRVDPVDRVLSDPTGFVREEAKTLVDPFDQRMSQLTEFYSQRDAIRDHGREKVAEAFQALDRAANNGDPDAIATVSRVRQSLDPYGDIVRWHQNAATLAETKGDLAAYRQRVLDEAMKDPDYVRKVVEASRQAAHQAGNVVTRPTVSAPPSLNKVGSAALPENMEDVSDAELFSSTTRRRRSG